MLFCVIRYRLLLDLVTFVITGTQIQMTFFAALVEKYNCEKDKKPDSNRWHFLFKLYCCLHLLKHLVVKVKVRTSVRPWRTCSKFDALVEIPVLQATRIWHILPVPPPPPVGGLPSAQKQVDRVGAAQCDEDGDDGDDNVTVFVGAPDVFNRGPNELMTRLITAGESLIKVNKTTRSLVQCQ